MKTYTKLDTKEAFNKAMDAGKTIQYWNVDEWMTKQPGSGFCNNTEYRTVEETKLPKQGDKIMVWDNDESLARLRLFVAFWRNTVIASGLPENTTSYSWNHWKPIDKKPREGWMFPLELSSRKEASGMIHVREVLEDE